MFWKSPQEKFGKFFQPGSASKVKNRPSSLMSPSSLKSKSSNPDLKDNKYASAVPPSLPILDMGMNDLDSHDASTGRFPSFDTYKLPSSADPISLDDNKINEFSRSENSLYNKDLRSSNSTRFLSNNSPLQENGTSVLSASPAISSAKSPSMQASNDTITEDVLVSQVSQNLSLQLSSETGALFSEKKTLNTQSSSQTMAPVYNTYDPINVANESLSSDGPAVSHPSSDKISQPLSSSNQIPSTFEVDMDNSDALVVQMEIKTNELEVIETNQSSFSETVPLSKNNNLSDSFSKISLNTDIDMGKPQKRGFVEIITPQKVKTRVNLESLEYINSPLRAPPPFKKPMLSTQVSDQTLPISKSNQLDDSYTSSLNSNVIHAEAQFVGSNITAAETLNKFDTKSAINHSLNTTPDTKKNFISAFDPFAPIPEEYRISTPDLEQMRQNQTMASLIPLPNSPTIAISREKGENIPIAIPEKNQNLLVPITPTRSQWTESNIDWEFSKGSHLYTDSDIVQQEKLRQDKEIESLNTLVQKQKDEFERIVASKEREMAEYMEMAKVATDKLEGELAEYKAKVEKLEKNNAEIELKSKESLEKLANLERKYITDLQATQDMYVVKLDEKEQMLKLEYTSKDTETKEALVSATNKLENIEKESESKFSALEDKFTKEVESLKKELEQEKQAFSKLQEEYHEYMNLSGEYMDLKEGENERLTKVIASLTVENHGIADRFNQAVETARQAQSNMEIAAQKYLEIENRLKDITTEKSALEKDLKIAVEREILLTKQFKKQEAIDKSRIAVLESDVNRLDSENDYLKAMITRFEFNLKKVTKEIESLKEENVELNNMCSELERMVSRKR
ncbi:hypothetical protein BB560_000156 [Smittium megazygosporum]|uniref:Uncharacterized protein n=1 Tax=Smittium megazygosporum TaxID=133381 RepID=A0A2T9ZL63_9FUNG|nr:hypothetical protein BB560_000156 [Smittium megazygosporum]